ncbi:MAG TPA: rhodanese-like domain-containing protein [Solimonas sp.]|nr:rhodanese-like domain-containing protein [Solimonas sp.]
MLEQLKRSFLSALLLAGPLAAAETASLPVQALAERLAQTPAAATLLDVRTAEEFAAGHIEGALNIPVQELEGRLSELPADAPVIVYCRSGRRATQAAAVLRGRGLTVTEVEGSFLAWQAAGLPEAQAPSAPRP